MRKSSILAALMVVCISSSFGQIRDSSIIIRKLLGGYQFYQNDKRLRMPELVKAMESSEQAYQRVKSARSNNTLASLIGGVGGFLVGWPIGAAIGGVDPNWTMAGIGAGLIVVSIPISINANKQFKKAVNMYNEGVKRSS